MWKAPIQLRRAVTAGQILRSNFLVPSKARHTNSVALQSECRKRFSGLAVHRTPLVASVPPQHEGIHQPDDVNSKSTDTAEGSPRSQYWKRVKPFADVEEQRFMSYHWQVCRSSKSPRRAPSNAGADSKHDRSARQASALFGKGASLNTPAA